MSSRLPPPLAAFLLRVAAFCLTVTPAVAAPDEIVTLASHAGDRARLTGYYAHPDGPGPFPAIVMLHGCGGLHGANGRDLSGLYRAWLTHFRDAGYAALLIDSFTPRGISEICTIPFKDRPIHPAGQRVGDAYAGLDWLRARAEIGTAPIGLVGWSNGGATVLASLARPSGETAARFTAAIAFYPGCESAERRGWTSATPLSILMGAIDDWTRPGPCQALQYQAKQDGLPVDITLYPDAYHGFDAPNSPVHTRLSAVGTVHLGTNEAARTAAFAAVDAFWTQHLKPGPPARDR